MRELSHILPVLKAIFLTLLSDQSVQQKARYVAPSFVAVLASLLMMVTRAVMWFLWALLFAKYIEVGETDKIAYSLLFRAMGVNVFAYLVSDVLIRKSAEKLQMMRVIEMMQGDE